MILDPLFKKWRVFLDGPVGSKLPDVGLLAMRLGFGLLMMFGHGLGKLQGYSAGAATFPDPLGVGNQLSMTLAVFAEFFCSALLILGLATRLALTQLIATMAVAFFIVHGKDGMAIKELSLVYMLAYVGMFIAGPGRLSIDAWLIGRCYCSTEHKRKLD